VGEKGKSSIGAVCGTREIGHLLEHMRSSTQRNRGCPKSLCRDPLDFVDRSLADNNCEQGGEGKGSAFGEPYWPAIPPLPSEGENPD